MAMEHVGDFPMKTFIYKGFPTAMFDYQRVFLREISVPYKKHLLQTWKDKVLAVTGLSEQLVISFLRQLSPVLRELPWQASTAIDVPSGVIKHGQGKWTIHR